MDTLHKQKESNKNNNQAKGKDRIAVCLSSKQGDLCESISLMLRNK